MSNTKVRSILVGQNNQLTLRYLLLAALVFILLFTVMSASHLVGLGVLFTGLGAAIGLFVLMFVPATIHAYWNRGLLVTILIAISPVLAQQEFVLLFRIGNPYPQEGLLYGVGISLLTGIPVGVVAFLAGRGLKIIKKKEYI